MYQDWVSFLPRQSQQKAAKRQMKKLNWLQRHPILFITPSAIELTWHWVINNDRFGDERRSVTVGHPTSKQKPLGSIVGRLIDLAWSIGEHRTIASLGASIHWATRLENSDSSVSNVGSLVQACQISVRSSNMIDKNLSMRFTQLR